MIEDPHLWARTLYDELDAELGFALSYQSLNPQTQKEITIMARSRSAVTGRFVRPIHRGAQPSNHRHRKR